MFKKNNISIKSIKIFIDYFFVFLLDQKINFLKLITIVEKFKIIVKLRFLFNLRQLKSYLSFIDWMRDYISFYVDINKSFQKRKIELLRYDFSIKNARRFYVFKTRLKKSFELKIIFFKILQNMLTKFFYFVHVNNKRQLFINLNVNKKFDFDAHLYYIKNFFFQKFCFKTIFVASRHWIDIFSQSFFYFNRNSLLIDEIKNRWHRMSIQKNSSHHRNIVNR